MNPPAVFRIGVALALAAVALDSAPALAGMPSPPGLTDVAKMRVQTLSFFGVVFLLSALAVRAVWNALRTDFPRLPHLSYPKALGLVGLWGLLFLLVLTMISGARELMTPGAWKRDGATYALADDPKASVPGPTEAEREARLALLGEHLFAHAARKGGVFPPGRDTSGHGAAVWAMPHPSGMGYHYVPGSTTADRKILAYEPGLFGDTRFALLTTGKVVRLTSADLAARLAAEDDE